MLLDCHSLFLCGSEQIVECYSFATVEMLLAFVPGGVNQNAATDHAMIGNGLD